MISLAARSKAHAREFRESIAVVTKAFAGKDDLHVSFDTGATATDGGKAVMIRDPEYLVEEHRFDEKIAEDISTCSSAHEAAHLKFKTDVPLFKKFILGKVKLGAHRESIFGCINLAEDQRIDALMGKERPGYLDMRNSTAPYLIKKLYRPDPSDNRRTLLTATVAKLYGVDFRWDLSNEAVEARDRAVAIFEKAATAVNQEEAYELGWQAYLTLFGEPDDMDAEVETEGPPERRRLRIPAPPKVRDLDDDDWGKDEDSGDWGETDDGEAEKEDEDDEDESFSGAGKGGSSPSGKGSCSKDSDDHHDPADADDDSDSSAGDPGGEDDPDRVAPEADAYDEELDDWIKAKSAELMKGDALAEGLSDGDAKGKLERDAKFSRGEEALVKRQEAEEQRKSETEHTSLSLEVERAYSKGVDAGVIIRYTKPRTIKMWAGRRIALKHTKEIRAMVADLTQAFKDNLRKARERDTYLHKSGSVRADRVWRGSILGDGRVFTRHEEKAAGGYAVKLLLDASGSMNWAEDKCAVVSYAVARALYDAGMAVSVEAFDAVSSSCAVIHHPLLLWGSPDLDNIFAYHAIEQNRDNYSIKAAGFDLLRRQETHKIMIVFSDGSPYHGGSSTAISMAGGVPGGGGRALVEDAAKAVRDLRQKGVKVLGIYFGSHADPVEAEIYGKDYIRVDDLSRFASAVRTYLTRIMVGA